MESDSDQFESADENFDSDSEEKMTKPKKQAHKIDLPEIQNIEIKEDTALKSNNTSEILLKTKTDNKDINIVTAKLIKETMQEENDNNENMNERKPRTLERRDRPKREPKGKLGTRLSANLLNANKHWEIKTEVRKMRLPPEYPKTHDHFTITPKMDHGWDDDWDSPPSSETDNIPKSKYEKCGLSPDLYVESKTNEYGVPPGVLCWEEDFNWPPTDQIDPKLDSALYSEKSELNPDNWDHEADYMELPQEKIIEDEPHEVKEQTGWGAWGNWGVSTLLSSASLGVSTITNSVSQGINTVLESGIGAPDPEALARLHRQQRETPEIQIQAVPEKSPSNNTQLFGLGNFVSSVSHISKLVESTGTKVLSGGLDTLETIGKKTMEVLQEGDPGLKKKRAFLKIEQDRPHLSQILREAKEKAEEENKILEQRHKATKLNYETIFDDFQGLVHLEALEMLSKQCDIKLETLMASLSGSTLADVQETMAQVKDFCELPEEEEEITNIGMAGIKERVETAVAELNIPISYTNFFESWSNIASWLPTDPESVQEIHEKAIESLAKLTAIAVEQFHKAGELLLVKEHRSTVDEADSLVQLTMNATVIIGIVAGKFSELLNAIEGAEKINDFITNIFFEAANSSTYIQDALNLMIPVLQVGVNISR